jgi:hypothetical protein
LYSYKYNYKYAQNGAHWENEIYLPLNVVYNIRKKSCITYSNHPLQMSYRESITREILRHFSLFYGKYKIRPWITTKYSKHFVGCCCIFFQINDKLEHHEWIVWQQTTMSDIDPNQPIGQIHLKVLGLLSSTNGQDCSLHSECGSTVKLGDHLYLEPTFVTMEGCK